MKGEIMLLMKKRIGLVIAALIMMLTVMIPAAGIPVSASTGLSLSELKAKFPAGKYWNGGNVDGYTSTACTCHYKGICIPNKSPCTCNHFQGGTQCNGFARKLAYDAYGSHLSTWPVKTSDDYVESLKPGDVVYNSSPHWFMVISVSADSVTVGECNYGGRCLIKWDRTIKKSTIRGYSGLKIYVAPYPLVPVDPVVCNCSTSYAGTYVCTTSSAPLNIRSGHGKDYGVIGSIPSGATVTVSKADGTWAHVTYGGVSGFASMSYLAKKETTTSVYPLPFKCYPLSTNQKAAQALYSDGSARGWIYNTDDCTIKEVYSSGLCLLNCEYNGSYQDLYAKISDFLCSTATPTQMTVEAKATTYYRSSGSDARGWIDPGDKVYIIGKSGSRSQVIYPHTDGTHRCAWVDTSALTHTHTPGAAATCTTPQVCTTCDALLVSAYGHSAGASATCNSAQTCTRCGVVLVDRLDHNLGADATCTTPQKCTLCGAVMKNALGHNPGTAATCTAAQKCTRCGTTLQNALGHNPGTAATCTAAQKCTRCGTTLQNALGHNSGAAATCTTAQKCTRCGTVLKNALGHSYSEVRYESTHPHAGYQICSVCNDKKPTGTYGDVADCSECHDQTMYGDANGDGTINGMDITAIRRSIAGGYTMDSFDESAADVNHDGVVNGMDITLIRRYLAGGYGVELN